MSDTKPEPHEEGDRLEQLKREFQDLRPVSSFWQYASQLLVAIGGIFSIVRYHYGWSVEEMGALWHLGFWGGYLGSLPFSITLIVLSSRLSRNARRITREFEEEKARRTLFDVKDSDIETPLEKQMLEKQELEDAQIEDSRLEQ